MFVTIKKRDLLKIFFTPLFVMMVEHIMAAISILFALELKADIFQITLITTIRSLMNLTLQIPLGILSDRLGRRPMLILSRVMITVGALLYVFAAESNHLIIASFVSGFEGGNFFPIMLSMVGDKTEPKERQQAMSTMYVFSSIGMLLGPIISSSLLILPQMSLRQIFQIVFVVQIMILIYVVALLPETKPKTSESKKKNIRLYVTDLIRQTNFQGLFIMYFLIWFSRSIFMTYIKVHAKVDLNLSNAEVASLDIYSNLAVMLIRFLSATILTRVPFRPALIFFLVLGGIKGLITPFASDYIFVMLVSLLDGISYGATRIMQNVLVANISTPENRGVANSLNEVAMSTGFIMISVTSPIVDISGFTPVFILGGIAVFIAAIPPLLRKADFENQH